MSVSSWRRHLRDRPSWSAASALCCLIPRAVSVAELFFRLPDLLRFAYIRIMGRLPRPIEDNLVYHALNRGNNRADIFADPGDHEAFLLALAKTQQRYPFRLFGCCLMTNHFHLLLRPAPGQSISRILQSLT